MTKKQIIKSFEDYMIARDSNKLVDADDIRNYYVDHIRYNHGIGIDEFVDMVIDSVNSFNEQIGEK